MNANQFVSKQKMAKTSKKVENGSKNDTSSASTSKTKTLVKENIGRKRRPYTRVNFTEAEKRELAGFIKLKQLIWRLDDPQHRIGNAVEKAWANIAAAMNRPGKKNITLLFPLK